MADEPEDAEHGEIPPELVELHEALEYQAAVEAEQQDRGDNPVP